MQRIIAATVVIALAGCGEAGQPTGASVAAGQLGNGGFAFTCDDSVACDRYSNTAKTFPDAIALSSTFRIQYVAKDPKTTGITVGAVGDSFIAPSPKGFTALRAGWATIVARNASGEILEFLSVPVQKPDSLVVYDAGYVGSSPTPITTVKMNVGDVRSLRALARAGRVDLAGTLQYEWTSPADGVLSVYGDATGKVTIVASNAGSTRVRVVGGTFEEELAVQVAP